MCSIVDTKELNSKSYSDQTDKFPIKSSRENKYIFVLYHYNTNTIHAVPIKGRNTKYIKQAWKDTFEKSKNMVKHLTYISWTMNVQMK